LLSTPTCLQKSLITVGSVVQRAGGTFGPEVSGCARGCASCAISVLWWGTRLVIRCGEVSSSDTARTACRHTLRVNRDGLAPELVELLLPNNVAHHHHQRCKGATRALVAQPNDLALGGSCGCGRGPTSRGMESGVGWSQWRARRSSDGLAPPQYTIEPTGAVGAEASLQLEIMCNYKSFATPDEP
jgi:hypothetical protein